MFSGGRNIIFPQNAGKITFWSNIFGGAIFSGRPETGNMVFRAVALGYVFTQIWDFPKISLFSKILSLTSFGSSSGNSCTKFAILDITFRFTCGQSDLYQNIVKFQNIMNKIIGFLKASIFLLFYKWEKIAQDFPNSSFESMAELEK